MADSAPKITEARDPKAQSPSAKVEDQNGLGFDDFEEIAGSRSQVGQTIDQLVIKQQENTVQNALWKAVVTATSDSADNDSRLERRRLEELREQLSRAYEEKKKQGKESNAQEPVIFEKLVSIFGKPLTEKIATKIESVVAEHGTKLQRDPAAVGKLSIELAKLLSAGNSSLTITVSPQAIDKALSQELSRVARSSAPFTTLPANAVDRSVIGPNLIESVKANPSGASAYLQTKEGTELLRARLSVESSPEGRVKLLVSLRESLGQERFAALVDAVDKHTGAPLVAHCVQLAAASHAEQRGALQALVEPSKGLFTSSQLERFGVYTVTSTAAVMESLRIEYERIPDEITATERARYESYRHAAKELGIDTPIGVTTESSHQKILDAAIEKFPGLKGLSWEEAYEALRELAGVDSTGDNGQLKLEDFVKQASELGVSILPQDPAGILAEKLGPDQEQEFARQHLAARLNEMKQVKELAVRLFTHMREVEGHEKRLVELKGMLAAGPEQEREKVLAQLEVLYSGIIPGFSRTTIKTQQAASRLYIEDLHLRIAQATDPLALQALCAARDSIEWQALNVRIRALLSDAPPKSDRVKALLMEFQVGHVDLLRGRRPQFVRAADDVLRALNATDEYVRDASHLYQTELVESHKKIARLEGRVEELESQISKQEEVVKGHWLPTSSYKNASEALEQLKRARGEASSELDREESRLTSIKERLGGIPELQSALLGRMGDNGSLNLGAIDPVAVEALVKRPEEIKGLSEKLERLSEFRQRSLDALSRSDLMGAASCSQPGFATSALTSVVRLQEILAADRAMIATDDGLRALSQVVSSESALGKAIVEILQSTRLDREKMDLLLARLSIEEALRVKLFLASYNKLELYEYTGRDRSADTRDLWNILSTCHNTQEGRELEDLASTIPQLAAITEAQELLEKLSESERSAVLEEYRKLSSYSLGESLLMRAPLNSPARTQVLLALCDAPFVHAEDLAPIFGGRVVPANTTERRTEFTRLIREDSEVRPSVPTEFKDLIKAQSSERAALLSSLPAMLQLNRMEDVEAIRKRIGELDSQFYRSVAHIVQGYDSGFLARSGLRQQLEDMRSTATEVARIELFDPLGELSSQARKLVELLSKENGGSDAVDYILHNNLRPEQMMLVEMLYLQHVSQRPSLRLSGDLRADIVAKTSGNALNSEKIQQIMRGEQDACDAYDLERLTEGLRTHNPQLTVRAMLAIQARERGKELLQWAIENKAEIKDAWGSWVAEPVTDVAAPSVKEAKELFDAVKKNDSTRIAVINTVNGASWALDKGGKAGEVIYNIGEHLASYAAHGGAAVVATLRDVYGATHEFRTATGEVISLSWDEMWSSDPGVKTRGWLSALLRSIEIDGFDVAIVGRTLASIPQEHRATAAQELREFLTKMPNSLVYRDGSSEVSIVEYARRAGGSLGDADARFLEQVLSNNADSQGTPPELAERYLAERARLEIQLKELSDIKAEREFTRANAQEFYATVCSLESGALKDLQGRMFGGKTRAEAVAASHYTMKANQRDLLRIQHIGIEDLRSTKEVIRVRGVALLSDILHKEDRGLRSEQSERDKTEVRQRDTLREWVVARKDVVKRWQHDSDIATQALAKYDFWFDVSLTVGKLAVCVGVASIPGLQGVAAAWTVFAVASVWNAVDKTYRVAYRGLDDREAFRQFAWEVGIDAICTVTFLGVARYRAMLIADKDGRKASEIMSRILTRREVKEIRRFPIATPEELGKAFGRAWKQGGDKILERVEKDVLLRPARVVINIVKDRPKKLWDFAAAAAGGSILKTAMSSAPPPSPTPGPRSGPNAGPLPSQPPPVFPLIVGRAGVHEEESLSEATRIINGPQPQPPVAPQAEAETRGVDAEQEERAAQSEPTAAATEAPQSEAQAAEQPAKREASSTTVPSLFDRLINGLMSFLGALSWGSDSPPPPPIMPPAPPPPSGGSRDNGGGSDSPGDEPGVGLRVHLDEGRRGLPANAAGGGNNKSQEDNLDLTFATMTPSTRTQPVGIPAATVQSLQLSNAFANAQGESNLHAQSNQNAQRNNLVNSLTAAHLVAHQQSALPAGVQQVQIGANAVPGGQIWVVNPEGAQAQTVLEVSAKRSIKSAKKDEELECRKADLKEGEATGATKVKHRDGTEIRVGEKEPGEKSTVTDKESIQVVHTVGNVPRILPTKHEEAQRNSDKAGEVAASSPGKHGESPRTESTRRVDTPIASALLHKSGEVVSVEPRTAVHAASVQKDASSIELRAKEIGVVSAHTTTPQITTPKVKSESTLDENSFWSEVDGDAQFASGVAARSRKKTKRKAQDEERLKKIIMDQLMRQVFEKSKREKLLRMLAALGMTEQEYRAFLAQLQATEVSRKEAAKIAQAEKIAVAVESFSKPVAPKIKDEGTQIKRPRSQVAKTRADHFARLRSQNTDKGYH